MQAVTPPVTTPNPAATTQVNLLTTQAVPTLTQLPVAIVSLAQGDSAIVNGVKVSRQGNTLVLQDADGSTQQVSGFFSGHLDEVDRLARLRAALEGNDAYTHGDTGLTAADVVPAEYQEVAAFGEPIQLAQADGGATPAADNGPAFASGKGIAPAAGLGLASAAVIAPASLALAAAAGGGGGGGAPAPLSAEAVAAANSVAVAVEGVVSQFQAGLQDGGTTTDTTLVVRVSLSDGIEVGDTVQLYNGTEIVAAAETVTSDNVTQGYVEITTSMLVGGAYNFRAQATHGSLLGPKSADGAFDITVNTGAQAVTSVSMAAVVGNTGGFVIDGVASGDSVGSTVKLAGDVNGDGYDDVIVGATFADPSGTSDAGKSYVVFGGSSLTTVNLSDVEAGTAAGFVINGRNSGDYGGVVSSAGDVNGDGLDDLLVAATYADATPGGANSKEGKAYLVLGKSDSVAVDLVNIDAGLGGFSMVGEAASDYLDAISAAGDVNGDGLADFILGAQYHDAVGGGGNNNAGRAYVVFGSTEFSTTGTNAGVTLSDVVSGTGGFAINGAGDERAGISVSSAGDVNGDGLADLLVGAEYGDPTDLSNAGRAYVVFGKSGDTSPVDLSSLTSGNSTQGFVINGATAGETSGRHVSAAGDVNGDGLADLIVANRNNGNSYVVFGKTSGSAVNATDLVAENGGGFLIKAASGSTWAVSGAGDINGDGLSDLIVGAPNQASYVVFGKTDAHTVSLSDIEVGVGGFKLVAPNGGNFGGSVSAAGDINGDGLADLVVGASSALNADGVTSGSAYVIFGATTGAFADTAVDQVGTVGDDTLTSTAIGQTLVGDAGDDTLIAKGESVLYGGMGDDTMVLDAAMVVGLQHTGVSTVQARVDGGGGIDAIKLSGDVALDLTAAPNQAGGSNPAGGSRIDSVEVVDLVAGEGANKLTIAAHDVFDMSSFNVFEATGRAQLLVNGDSDDTVELDGVWSNAGASAVTYGGVSYDAWNSNSTLATIYVEQGIAVM